VASEGLRAICEILRAGSDASSPDDPMDERRAAMDAFAAGATLPDGVVVETVDAGGVPAERIVPPGAEEAACLLYLHGGAYVAGSLVTHRAHVARVADALGCQAVQVDYRLAPEHPFPAAVQDAVAAATWLADSVDPQRTLLAGDSAGGGLSLAAMVAVRDEGGALPAAAALISPWTDLTMAAATYRTRAAVDPMIAHDRLSADAERYLAGADPRTPLASPLFADLSGLPPMLVQVGDAECLLDDSIQLAERARAAGVDCELEVTPEAIHVWHAFAEFAPEGAEAVERLAVWARPRIGLPA
jgi:epsilon-lactone hydrolase